MRTKKEINELLNNQEAVNELVHDQKLNNDFFDGFTEALKWVLGGVGNSLKEPRHVCGAQGYDPMRGDVCEACKRERGQ